MRSASRPLVLCILLGAAVLRAQSTFATILGAIRDPSGAAVPDAVLALRNLDENTVTASRSSSQGLYEFLNLAPGRYQLTAERRNFKTIRTPAILLHSRETRRGDFTLEVASRTDSVIVAAGVTAINSEDGTVADSKNFEHVTRLPLNTRALTSSPFGAVVTIPGVQADRFGQVSVGGGLPAQVEWSVDGISSVDIQSHKANYNTAPSSEMVAEFRVASVDNNAAFGPMGDVTVVTKSGGNQPHGSLLWYHQNAALDAKTWGSLQKQQKVYNTFGSSLGGPVYLPHVYNGRNRTFFFADYEGNRQPNTHLSQYVVPSATMRHGDLTGLSGGKAVDPGNGAPFPGNRIPASRINPVATRLLGGYYPLPNIATPGAAYDYQTLSSGDYYADGYDFRVDHVLNARQRIFARWSAKSSDSVCGGCWGPLPASDYFSANKGLMLAHTLTRGAGLSNESPLRDHTD